MAVHLTLLYAVSCFVLHDVDIISSGSIFGSKRIRKQLQLPPHKREEVASVSDFHVPCSFFFFWLLICSVSYLLGFFFEIFFFF